MSCELLEHLNATLWRMSERTKSMLNPLTLAWIFAGGTADSVEPTNDEHQSNSNDDTDRLNPDEEQGAAG